MFVNRWRVFANDGDNACRTQILCQLDRPIEHGLSANLLQHFWGRGLHARALTRGQNDRGAGAFRLRVTRIGGIQISLIRIVLRARRQKWLQMSGNIAGCVRQSLLCAVR